MFASLRAQLGDPIFLRLHPDWSAGQAEAVRETCTNPDRRVLVAIAEDNRLIGFVAIWLNAYQSRIGAVDMIAVNPEHQRQGVARELMRLAADHMRTAGMDIAVVETGGDPGHAPARATYEAVGYTLLRSPGTSQCCFRSPSEIVNVTRARAGGLVIPILVHRVSQAHSGRRQTVR